MSFNGQPGGAWQRIPAFHQGAIYMAPQPNMSNFAHGPMPTNSMFGPGASAISYPQPRGTLNPVAFPHSPSSGGGGGGGSGGGGGGGGTASGTGGHGQQYNSIGTVTKFNNDCGLVNDEVFFYRNVCKGQTPKLGDRVLFEASYSTSGQFKWNATRIQLMPPAPSHQPQPLMGKKSSGSGYNAVPPPGGYERGQHSPRRSSPLRDRHVRIERDRRDRERAFRSREREREDDEHDRKRRREEHDHSRERLNSLNRNSSSKRYDRGADRERDRDRERERERERERDREREASKISNSKRDREPDTEESKKRVARVPSPYRAPAKGRRPHAIRRYLLQIPKSLLSLKSADIHDLRERFPNLYIPSDFFHAKYKWTESFTPDKPFSLRRPSQFHIMHRIVEPPYESKLDELEPADANFLYSAKVMLMACPPIAEIYRKCFEDDDSDTDQYTLHPTRLISFLVGTRRQKEPMCIGGPWSPLLDGEHPDKDPAVLIRTAIRTCKALTGIDLSNCTQWYRFMEIYYHREEFKNKGKEDPPRIETVVIYLPDIYSCMPYASDWQNLTQYYKTAAENVIARKVPKESAAYTEESTTIENTTTGDDSDVKDTTTLDDKGVLLSNNKAAANSITSDKSIKDQSDGGNAKEMDGGNDHEKADQFGPTHYSKLDPTKMSAQEMRDELKARNLPIKGGNKFITEALIKALDTERNQEEQSRTQKAAQEEHLPKDKRADVVVIDDEDEDVMRVDEDLKEQSDDVATENDNADNNNDDGNGDEAEEQDDWPGVDVDMSDIVILDEYDATKNPEDNSKEADEMINVEQLKRRYTLPAEPHIVVHPNKSAKSGKFDCSVVPLSTLLDYRVEPKERSFEVSMFAELFNEMLIRDFGFNIYKELYLYKDKDSDINNTKDDHSDNKKTATQTQQDEEKGMEISKVSAEVGSPEKNATDRRTTKRGNDSESNADETQSVKSSGDRKHKSTKQENGGDKKTVVVKPELLLSFVFFDTTQCGYIFENDLEELFSIIGLKLCRAQIRKVLGKFTARKAFYYRKLTHKVETAEALPTIEDADDIPADELKLIGLGNKKYDFVFNDHTQETKIQEAGGSNDLVNYNGAVIHVSKLMDQIKRTEKSLTDYEKLFSDLNKQHNDLFKTHSRSATKIKDLQSEVKSLTRKLSDADQEIFSLNRKYRDQHTALSDIFYLVEPYFGRDKDKEHKSDSVRDKDKHSDKEIDKEKNKDSKSKESKEKDPKGKDLKDKDSKEHNGKKKNTKENEKDSKENEIKEKANKEKIGEESKTKEVETEESKIKEEPKVSDTKEIAANESESQIKYQISKENKTKEDNKNNTPAKCDNKPVKVENEKTAEVKRSKKVVVMLENIESNSSKTGLKKNPQTNSPIVKKKTLVGKRILTNKPAVKQTIPGKKA